MKPFLLKVALYHVKSIGTPHTMECTQLFTCPKKFHFKHQIINQHRKSINCRQNACNLHQQHMYRANSLQMFHVNRFGCCYWLVASVLHTGASWCPLLPTGRNNFVCWISHFPTLLRSFVRNYNETAILIKKIIDRLLLKLR